MILLNFGLVLAAVALLIIGLGTGNVALVWASVGASVIAAACLAFVATARRRGGLVEPAFEDAAVSAGGQVPGAREPERPARMAGAPDTPTAEPTTAPIATPTGHAHSGPATPAPNTAAEPEEHPAAADAELIAGRDDLVLVVDGLPRYHLFTCPRLADQETVPLALREAKADGFTPCGQCRPDSTLAESVRAIGDDPSPPPVPPE